MEWTKASVQMPPKMAERPAKCIDSDGNIFFDICRFDGEGLTLLHNQISLPYENIQWLNEEPTITDHINTYFKNASIEQQRKDWAEMEEIVDCGPTVEEYLKIYFPDSKEFIDLWAMRFAINTDTERSQKLIYLFIEELNKLNYDIKS